MKRPIAMIAALMCISSGSARAQEMSDAAKEVWDRLPNDKREAYFNSYGFDLFVPIDVLELTSDVIAVSVSCELYSSYMVDPETVVARGETLVIDDDTGASTSANFERVYEEAHWIEAENLRSSYQNSQLPVPMLQISEVPIESWTHGDCSLKILAWDGKGGGFDNRRSLDPIECEYGSVSDPGQLAACHSNLNGFELSSYSPFGRLGYDNNGRALN